MVSETFVRLRLKNGAEALLDVADFDREASVAFSDGIIWTGRICDLLWYPLHRTRVTYAHARPWLAGRQRSLYLHRAVMNVVGDEWVDHRDGNGLNNRRHNLRLATKNQNAWNQRTPSDSSCGYKGVSFYSRTGRYRAGIGHNSRVHHIGYFDTPEAAALAYNAKALELFGEFARLNEVPQ